MTAHEDEQGRRADLLASRGVVRVVREEALSAAGLARAIRDVAATRPPALSLDTAGGARSARLIREMIRARAATRAAQA
ncbi:MAG: hypothetical protein R2712_28420 [Vicinamibacterales bacterium]